MKFLIVCLAIAGYVSAGLLPAGHYHHPSSEVHAHATGHYHHATGEAHAHTVSAKSDLHPDGHYDYAYHTDNGITVQESGLGGKSSHGSFSYTAPDGQPITVEYVADEHGFRPQGAHLPVAPPVPEAIQRSLAWNAAHPQQPEPVHAVSAYTHAHAAHAVAHVPAAHVPVAHVPVAHSQVVHAPVAQAAHSPFVYSQAKSSYHTHAQAHTPYHYKKY